MAIINGTTANDTLNGTSDQDTLSGYDGNDQLYGNGGNDIIYGGNGDDVLGNGGGVRVDGVVVEDNDVYIGGAGNDTIEIYTSYGSDIIVFNKGDGHDTIRSHNNNTVLQLGEGFSKSDVKFVGYMNSFFITFINSPGDSIFVDAEYGSSKYYLQTLKFHDGTTLDISPNNINNVIYREGGAGHDRIHGDFYVSGLGQIPTAEIISGYDGNDQLYGGGGNDIIYGGNGDDGLGNGWYSWEDGVVIVDNDIYIGGAGNDTIEIQVSYGSDIIVFNKGDGHDTIRNDNNNTVLQLGEGFSKSDIKFVADGNSFYITFINSPGDSIFVDAEYGSSKYYLQTMKFHDGTTLDISPNNINNVIYRGGGTGNDRIHGDFYVSGLGQIPSADIISGYDGNDHLYGGGGNDIIYGGNGDDGLGNGWYSWEDGVVIVDNDIYIGGAGNDTIEIQVSYGSDIIVFNKGDGHDTIRNDNNNTVLQLGEGFSKSDIKFVGYRSAFYINFMNSPGDSIVVDAEYGSSEYYLQTLKFHDGTTLDISPNNMSNAFYREGGAGNDTIYGDFYISGNISGYIISSTDIISGYDGNDILDGRGGNDVLDGGNGDDSLRGGSGNDVLQGGRGNDYLVGESGINTYVFNRGDGMDKIVGGNDDVIVLGQGISASNIKLVKDGDDLLIRFLSHPGDSIRILGQFKEPYNVINQIRFSDLSTLDISPSNTRNVLYSLGTEVADTLTGYAGVDIMSGAGGDDTYTVNVAGDKIIEAVGQGFDRVLSSVSYTLGAFVEALTLTGADNLDATGNKYANVLTGNNGANRLFGLSGNDVLIGAGGDDALFGGGGNDVYVVEDAGDTVTEFLGEGLDLIQSSVDWILGDHFEQLQLQGTGDLRGTGNELKNRITGNSGNNVLDGGGSGDILIGGGGDDTYRVDRYDTVTELANEGTDTVFSGVTMTLSDHVENLVLTGAGHIRGTGNVLDNALTGNAGANFLFGLDGHDTLLGLEGNDTLDGGLGADSLSGGLGNDTYLVNEAGDLVLEGMDEGTDRVLSAVTWTLGAHLEDLTLTGAEAIQAYGNDSENLLVGNLAANRLLGYGGNDLLDGGQGADRMVGGRGDDVYVVDDAADLVYEYVGEGQDTVMAAISLTLGRGLENLVLTGTAKLNGAGNAADNLVTGNSADNQLAGGAGNDILKGGLGNDTYVVARGDGADTLIDTDRTAGNTDVLRFLGGVARDQLWFSRVGASLQVSIIGTGTRVTISNWYVGSANRVEQIFTSDGASTLLSGNVENLVNAMAAFGARPDWATSLTSAEHARLDAVIAANWT